MIYLSANRIKKLWRYLSKTRLANNQSKDKCLAILALRDGSDLERDRLSASRSKICIKHLKAGRNSIEI